ncbi:MAG TPA: hypothetical protein DF383_05130, partial [Deltaproteobacteria bacterium]|nr:hypothetical protein [Deltaproteobacteria bacterium]
MQKSVFGHALERALSLPDNKFRNETLEDIARLSIKSGRFKWARAIIPKLTHPGKRDELYAQLDEAVVSSSRGDKTRDEAPDPARETLRLERQLPYLADLEPEEQLDILKKLAIDKSDPMFFDLAIQTAFDFHPSIGQDLRTLLLGLALDMVQAGLREKAIQLVGIMNGNVGKARAQFSEEVLTLARQIDEENAGDEIMIRLATQKVQSEELDQGMAIIRSIKFWKSDTFFTFAETLAESKYFDQAVEISSMAMNLYKDNELSSYRETIPPSVGLKNVAVKLAQAKADKHALNL